VKRDVFTNQETWLLEKVVKGGGECEEKARNGREMNFLAYSGDES
jgi:hypothetical protein